MINFMVNEQEYSAENHAALLIAMHDLKINQVRATYTFFGQNAYSSTLDIKDVEKLAKQERSADHEKES